MNGTSWVPAPGTLDAIGHALGVTGDWQLAQNLGVTFDELQAVRYGRAAMSLLAANRAWELLGKPASFLTWFTPYVPEGGLNVSADRAA